LGGSGKGPGKDTKQRKGKSTERVSFFGEEKKPHRKRRRNNKKGWNEKRCGVFGKKGD